MSQTETAPRTWQVPRPLLKDFLGFTLLAWAGTVVAVLALTLGLAYFSDVPGSIWGYLSGAVRVYLAIIAGYLVFQFLPLYVTHGQTRRDFAIEALIVLLAQAGLATVLITVSYLLEAGLYLIAGWPLSLPEEHLFTSHGDVLLIVVEHALAFLVWTAVGAFVGAVIYRSREQGWIALLPAVALLSLASAVTGQSVGFITRIVELGAPGDAPSVGFAVVASIACLLVAAVLAWRVIRDAPIRNR